MVNLDRNRLFPEKDKVSPKMVISLLIARLFASPNEIYVNADRAGLMSRKPAMSHRNTRVLWNEVWNASAALSVPARRATVDKLTSEPFIE